MSTQEYLHPWIFDNAPISTIEDKYVGFVYLITNLVSGKKYIGKKLTKFSRTKTTKGKKKKIKVESDWKTYWSSSDDVKRDVKDLGEDNFKREILKFCLSKGTASYFEAKYQFQNEVLENPKEWYNAQIRCRIHRSHLKSE